MKKLGFGCMRLPLTNPEDPTSVDLKQFCEMIDTFMDNGFTYFDTAYPYHQRQSELFVKKALVERYPRNSFTLADKLPNVIKLAKHNLFEIHKFCISFFYGLRFISKSK